MIKICHKIYDGQFSKINKFIIFYIGLDIAIKYKAVVFSDY